MATGFKPRAGMKYSQYPLPARWKCYLVGMSAGAYVLYLHDYYTEKARYARDHDQGGTQFYPLTDPPACLDEHLKSKLPMRSNFQYFFEPPFTEDSVRPIRGVEDVEGAPIWSSTKYRTIEYFRKKNPDE